MPPDQVQWVLTLRNLAVRFDPQELDEQYNLDKEEIARNWFFVGCELAKVKRSFKSTKLFGIKISETDFRGIANHDRSVAIWMFEHWRDVLDWIAFESGRSPTDPFGWLAMKNASHPAHIKRQVLKWKKAPP